MKRDAVDHAHLLSVADLGYWDALDRAVGFVAPALWHGFDGGGDSTWTGGDPWRRRRHLRREEPARELCAAVCAGVAAGRDGDLRIWCLFAADAVRRFEGLHPGAYALGPHRLGAVSRAEPSPGVRPAPANERTAAPGRHVATVLGVHRVASRTLAGREPIGWLLYRLLTADPRVTPLVLGAPPAPPGPGSYDPVAELTAAAERLRDVPVTELAVDRPPNGWST
ncbi:hypothetical protein [Virgisporangium aliadipatigenens]|uniref:hypothetical protein n=1 Tax=Virgisporangium aliadipatigenens TaxID=741659 RepID=UPI0019417DF2|nr:hypothetical protein [Virgisporangium aliadipatigenens]